VMILSCSGETFYSAGTIPVLLAPRSQRGAVRVFRLATFPLRWV
jgi:hypothetical protein